MRRTRNELTKVWHNPDLDTFATRRRSTDASSRPQQTGESRRELREHRAALDALFAPKRDDAARDPGHAAAGADVARVQPGKGAGRIVLAPPPQSDPKATERQRLLARVLGAEGRPAITKAANDFLRAGFSFPEEQDVHLQLLEHLDESLVQSSLASLSVILLRELPQRRAVLESRLRRIEQFAEEAASRAAAEGLRRRVTGRAELPTTGP